MVAQQGFVKLEHVGYLPVLSPGSDICVPFPALIFFSFFFRLEDSGSCAERGVVKPKGLFLRGGFRCGAALASCPFSWGVDLVLWGFCSRELLRDASSERRGLFGERTSGAAGERRWPAPRGEGTPQPCRA